MPNEPSDRPDEPAENISGGPRGGGEHTVTPAESSDPEPTTRAEAVVDNLGERYWQKAYGGRDAFECLVRTILSQNTSDTASQPAHDSLLARYGGSADRTGAEDGGAGLASALATAEQDELAETISAAGLYNQKSETIIRLAGRIVEEYEGEAGFDEFVKSGHPDEVRDTLLKMKGVGPKTADCVLLFSGGRGGVFPVDTHVHRIARRMGLAPANADHEEVREAIESAIPPGKCGFGHTAMIQFGREYCTARKPACLDGPEACPLVEQCDQVGVDELSGEVIDPADVPADD
ncbi:MAG: endonuclease III [Halolamina sp.]|uniref:endonuclease III domain-containing protein n=1 Tax=Halolamina sp. TaxID=1940283 RepID=UPI002FC2EFC5